VIVAQGVLRDDLDPRGLEALTPGVGRGLETITSADVKRRVEIIADDSMGGRDTPSKGLEATARYIAAEFGRLGLAPRGDAGTFIQRYPIPGERQGQTQRTAPNVVGMLEGPEYEEEAGPQNQEKGNPRPSHQPGIRSASRVGTPHHPSGDPVHITGRLPCAV
jgi:hypothetical protein